jgi:hypothetical protein
MRSRDLVAFVTPITAGFARSRKDSLAVSIRAYVRPSVELKSNVVAIEPAMKELVPIV